MNVKSLRKLPINIDLLRVSEEDVRQLKPISEIQIFNNTNQFHPEGLFSTTVFSNIGSEYRNRIFGYINLKTTILHPMIYDAIVSLKSFYGQILSGTSRAVWDDKLKEFIKSNDQEADTGFEFFYSHIEELKFEETGSDTRSFLIKLYKHSIKTQTYGLKYFLVLPAGLRDYMIDANGKPQEDEINSLYRKLIVRSGIIDEQLAKKTPEIYDSSRIGIQLAANEVFTYIQSLLEGKHKLILGKWLTRKIFNSTRNVLANPIEYTDNINDPNRLGYNDCFAGLHQYLRALVPKTLFEIKNRYIPKIFIENNNFAYLVNTKTLKKEEVISSHIQKDYDLWMSSAGLEKIIANFGNLDTRHLPIMLNKGKHYLGLVYNDGKHVKFLQDIDEVPEQFSKEHVKPITYAEFLYLSIYTTSGKYPGLIARYPITGYGSIYPAWIKVKTTTTTQSLIELNDQWEPTDSVASCFPIRDLDFFNALSVHTSHYGALGADCDGDTMSLTALTLDESVDEIKEHLMKKEYYISSDNQFYFDISNTTLDAVLAYMS